MIAIYLWALFYWTIAVASSRTIFFQVEMGTAIWKCVPLTLGLFAMLPPLPISFSSFPSLQWVVDSIGMPPGFFGQLVHLPLRCFEFFLENCHQLREVTCWVGVSTLLNGQWSIGWGYKNLRQVCGMTYTLVPCVPAKVTPYWRPHPSVVPSHPPSSAYSTSWGFPKDHSLIYHMYLQLFLSLCF